MAMSGRYTISQLAVAADVPTTTLRSYERIGFCFGTFYSGSCLQRLLRPLTNGRVSGVLNRSVPRCRRSLAEIHVQPLCEKWYADVPRGATTANRSEATSSRRSCDM